MQGLFRWAYIGTQNKGGPVAKPVYPDAHAQCYKWSQLLHNHVKSLFTECGVRGRRARAPDHCHLGQLLFSYIASLQGLLPHNICTVHLPRHSLGELILTLGSTSHNNSKGYNKQHSSPRIQPGTHVTCKSPHRHQAHPFKEGIFVLFTVHPHDYTF